jgi:RNA polymerase sigma-70 factor (ECF subfamily)
MKNEFLLVSRAALAGDDKAFGHLVESYQSPVRRMLLNLTGGDGELSNDLAQETFIRAWLKIGSFRAASKFSTWLYRIAYNTFCDHARSHKVNAGIEIAERMEGQAENRDISMDFAGAMAILRDEERAAMQFFYMEDLTVEKISKIMDCPAGTVKSHLSRGREKLSKYFKNAGYE